MERFPYKVISGRDGFFASEGKDYPVGDTVELPKSVAMEFRNQLEALTDEGRLEDPVVAKLQVSHLRDHEKEGLLRERKKVLEDELDKIDAELDRIEEAKKPTPETPATPTPAAAPAPATKARAAK